MTLPPPRTVRSLEYRADIDGLRAVSVAAVLLFHAFPNLVPGGFVGVDVFFVISGYLITGILLANMDRGNLRLLDFYRHRVRRIVPALVLVIASCFAIGWLVLFAGEYSQLCRQIAASAVFISNFELWHESGYFDIAAETKPLLHLWSLAVEEQFYLVWPPLLWLGLKLRIGSLSLAVSGVILSFAASLLLARHDPVADFYSPAARFWEILSGAVLICAQRRLLFRPGPAVQTSLSLAGGVMLGGSFWLLQGAELYPGWRAVFPVLASVLILAAGPKAVINRQMLAARPLVAIGMISYPLYLWHWPLLAFARILVGSEPPVAMRAMALAVSGLLAALTYAVVERPLRFGPHGTAKTAILCLSLLALGGAGHAELRAGTPPLRYIDTHTQPSGLAALTQSSPFVTPCSVNAPPPAWGWCYADTREPPAAAIMGDSHGQALFWALVRASQPHHRWMMVGRPGCAPMSGMQRVTQKERPDWPADDPAECAAYNAAALKYVLDRPYIRIVLIVIARRVIEDEDYSPVGNTTISAHGAFDGISDLLGVLRRAGKKTVILQDNPAIGSPPDCVPRLTGFSALDEWLPRLRGRGCNLPYDQYVAATKIYRQSLADLKRHNPDLTIFDTTPLLCNAAADRCPMVRNGKLLYSYGDHVSNYGGDIIAAALLPTIDTLLQSR